MCSFKSGAPVSIALYFHWLLLLVVLPPPPLLLLLVLPPLLLELLLLLLLPLPWVPLEPLLAERLSHMNPTMSLALLTAPL